MPHPTPTPSPISGVYELRNTITGEPYIGSASNAPAAWRRLKQRLAAGQHPNMALQEAWNRFGEEAFVFAVIEPMTDRRQMHAKAKERIAAHRPNYNVDFWPREQVVTHVYEHNGVATHSSVYPYRRMKWQDYDDAGQPIPRDDGSAKLSSAPVELTVQRQSTYHMPLFEYDVPLLQCSDGTVYVPVEAWYAMLGTRPSYHFGRIKHTFLWEGYARELPYVPLSPSPASSDASATVNAAEWGELPLADTDAGQQQAKASPIPSMVADTPDHPDQIDGAPANDSAPLTVATQSGWCLPPETFSLFAGRFSRKQQPLSEDIRKRIHAYWEQEWEAEERQRKEQFARVRQFLVERKRLTVELVGQQQTRERLFQIVAAIRPHLHDASADELLAYDRRAAQGVELLDKFSAATRAALEKMQHTRTREYSNYDFYGNLVDNHSEPVDPQLPDSRDMETHERAFALWQRAFLRWLRAKGFVVDEQPGEDRFPDDGLN